MKTKTTLLVLLFLSLGLSHALMADGGDYDINNFSEDFISSYVIAPLNKTVIASRSYVNSGSGCSINITKVGTHNDDNGDGLVQAGETIVYSFTICNDGTEDLFNVTVQDPLVAVSGSIASLPAMTGSGTAMTGSGTGATCDFTTFSTSYVVTNQDAITGFVSNTAVVQAFDIFGNPITSSSNTVIIPVVLDPVGPTPDPSISLTKSGLFNDENGNGFAEVGETITYTFQVCNTGNEVVSNVVIFDVIAPVNQSITSIPVGGCSSAVFSSYTLSPNDVLNGQVTNIATTSGTSTSGILVADTSDDPFNSTNFDSNGDGEPDDPTLTVFDVNMGGTTGEAAISIDKVGTFNDENSDGFAQAGETISYTFTVCNEGDEDVFNITIDDPLVDVQGSPIDLFASTGSGSSCNGSTFTASYILNETDVANGQVMNIAIASGLDRFGNVVLDFSDDPFNPNNFDQNNDGNPDDPTITTFSSPPVELSAAIGNFVFEDLNGNGLQDSNEPGIAGVTVGLFNTNDILVAIAVTDASGFYLFEDVVPGDYYLEFETPSGLELTFANSGGTDLADSDVDGSNGPNTTATTTLVGGEVDLTWDAGFYTCIPLGESVWYDINENSIQDSNENGINGIKVEIWRLDGGSFELYDLQFTGHKPGTASDDGFWKVCAPPGTYYINYIIPPFGLVPVIANAGFNDQIDSDLTGAFGPGTTDSFTVTSGDERCDIGAGYYPQGTLGDRVWFDTNRNGVQEINEPGAGGIPVRVFDMAGNVVTELVTAADGTYRAEFLQDAEYYIAVQPPLGYAATTANVSSEDVDSDIDHSFGANTTAAFRTTPGNHTPHVDAGLVSSSILAVDWVSADVIRKNDINEVNWTVASDTEVDRYTVERKMGDIGAFTQVGVIEALHQENNVSYSWTDSDSQNDGVYFYRIKMEMYDGSGSYSDIMHINVTDAADIQDLVSIYPNPAISQVTLTVDVAKPNSNISVNMTSALGQKVLINSILSENLDTGIHQFSLDVTDYARGSYILEIFVGEERTVNRIVLVE